MAGYTSKSSNEGQLALIGEVAEEFGFTARALRLYEEKGLLSPTRVGARRVYSQRDRRRLETIAKGKRIGLALDDIREIVWAEESLEPKRSVDVALKIYNLRVEEMEVELDELRERLQEARALVAGLKAQLAGP